MNSTNTSTIGIPYADMDLATMKRICPVCGERCKDGKGPRSYQKHYMVKHAPVCAAVEVQS
jgi:hypothetical protein